MFKSLHKSEDISLSIQVDSTFTGILRGFAHDVSEGCTLKGELTMTINRRSKIRMLETVFTGICRVNFKTCNKMGVPTSDGTESKGIYRKRECHFDETAINNHRVSGITSSTFEPGTYRFPFSFNIPASLPHSFKGKHGSIDYELNAYATRSVFSTDVHACRPITLRRCLMNTLGATAQGPQTVEGRKHPDILKYSATSPSMVYCEGGLLDLSLHVELKDPERYSVRIVTCGLKERIVYRTTGKSSLTNQAMHYNESSFPLGCSTFFPSQHPEYNPADLHNYSAVFRLYPRVHTDNKSSLIAVQHILMIRMIVDDNEARVHMKRERSMDSITSIGSAGARSLLSHLSIRQQDRSSPRMPIMTPINIPNSNNNNNVAFDTSTPPVSRSPSISDISVDTVASGESVLSISPPSDMEPIHPFQSNLVRVSSRKLERRSQDSTQFESSEEESSNNEVDGSSSGPRHHLGHSLTIHHHFNPFQFHKGGLGEGSYECTLSMPIIVTSREEYREGDVPALPDYETAADEPPSYRAALQSLPPVPIYTDDEMELQND